MKLRNKKTGEIIDVYKGQVLIHYDQGRKTIHFKSLEDLEKWEDYEEPKEHWAIDQFGEPINVSGLSRLQLEKLHRLGNDFPSKNATMKAIEKLKAWKRLKDKGFRFVGWRGDNDKHHLDGVAWYEMRLCGGYNIETADDLEMIFGPEEEEE